MSVTVNKVIGILMIRYHYLLLLS